jgi:Mg2+-importing ATPase
MQINFWSLRPEKLISELNTSDSSGLTAKEASTRLKKSGRNTLKGKKEPGKIVLFLNQFKSPLIIILLFASLLSLYLGEKTDSGIILFIVFISGFLGYWQEKGAARAVHELISAVKIKAGVLRDGTEKEVFVEEVVPGDIALLKAGDMIPGDCFLLEVKNLFVNEATLTGETFPVAKEVTVLEENTPLAKRTNNIFMGTYVISGEAKALVINTGKETELGKVSEHLLLQAAETEFESGIRHFGYLLSEITLILVILIFAGNVYFNRPVVEAFLFSLALAVGLTPQLLPAIISINLAHGARKMAKQKVIVKHLPAIENLGSMNILCSDKTGTITQGIVKVKSALDINGKESDKALLYACINAAFESGYANPIDISLRSLEKDTGIYRKLDEIPYDFTRKCLSILVSDNLNNNLLVTKGALVNILAICNSVEVNGEIKDIENYREQIQKDFEQLSHKGYRVLGIAYRNKEKNNLSATSLEKDLTFLGFLVLEDPPKPGIEKVIAELGRIGVSLKMITGDNRLVAANLGLELGLDANHIITGPELNKISNEALYRKILKIAIFAEIEPNQKERIVRAFRKTGNVVGYIGDGINDVSALHAADVSISVDTAADVAKETAEIVMLDKDLEILVDGIKEGRRTFINTLKYIFMATSANFGNMFSMAGSSLFLSFLPLLPKQVLLTNLFTDFPELTIAGDNVEPEMIDKPQKWDIKLIKKFMLTFGLISSFYDYLTFYVLIYILHANTEQFRTGWFIESVVSAAAIVLVIRTRRPFYKSSPGKFLLLSTVLIILLTLNLPHLPFSGLLGFTALPPHFLPVVLTLVFFYALTAELAKHFFYKHIKN